MKTLISGVLTAAFLSVCAVGLTPVKAGEPAVKGSVATPGGVPARSYPVIVNGITAWGENYKSFVTTDNNGVFVMMKLPPGKYTVMPAGQPESSVKFTIQDIPWYNSWTIQRTEDVGDLSVNLGGKLMPN